MAATILVADDDQKLLKMVRRTLVYEGFAVITASTGREALAKMETQSPDLIVLDWMMPELDGLELLKRLRVERADIPVLMLTARDAIEDRVVGLDQGADDYLVKPFAPSELLARLRALLRRAKFTLTETTLTYADLSLDPVTRETRRGSRQFELTPKEFELLHLFMRYPRQVLVRDRILEEIWSYDFGGEDNVLEVYVGYLRKKIEANGEPRLIHTVRGVGYVLREG
ncbi:MAG: DNA-binding response regulator [Anaerolineae bacterium]|nr:response regulator transcription factor [Anaerolineales bacterium]MCQ3971846.1 DNA-binding response regulator [Anaerolineae bacterium]